MKTVRHIPKTIKINSHLKNILFQITESSITHVHMDWLQRNRYVTPSPPHSRNVHKFLPKETFQFILRNTPLIRNILGVTINPPAQVGTYQKLIKKLNLRHTSLSTEEF